MYLNTLIRRSSNYFAFRTIGPISMKKIWIKCKCKDLFTCTTCRHHHKRKSVHNLWNHDIEFDNEERLESVMWNHLGFNLIFFATKPCHSPTLWIQCQCILREKMSYNFPQRKKLLESREVKLNSFGKLPWLWYYTRKLVNWLLSRSRRWFIVRINVVFWDKVWSCPYFVSSFMWFISLEKTPWR